ncbi:DUF3566 domain-containing protein [Cellulomonas sp. 179-A 9B4 NHS]|uniref:DUF3566 domain-containing protein n=1 Tax=Cellulomonas sp. 179-A 9B4 NHS TaxID=3142379 RepID=UPI00399F11CB
MTDTPPSIPPRKRPTPPATGASGRATGGATTTERTSTKPGTGARSTGPTGPRTGASGGSSAGSSAGSAAEGTVREGAPTVAERAAGAGPADGARTPDATRATDTGRPADAPGTAADADGAQEPSPLVTAVDTTTVWLKKAAGATSTKLSQAYSQLTRPRTEDPQMTTTPDAPATAAAASTATAPAAGAAPRPTGPATGATARPATGRIPTVGGPRRVRLSVSRVDPWSVMKLAFLLSVAVGIMIVVAAAVLWFTLDGLQVFARVDELIAQVAGPESTLNVLDYVSFQKTISAATLVAVIDVFLLTALATIGAFLYNLVAALVGGVHVTMTDE